MTQTSLLNRIRAEYLEMPGLRVTLEQAQRLFGLDWTLCKAAFDLLVTEDFLRVSPRGLYARATDGGVSGSRRVGAAAVSRVATS
jgi:hypothetical protein